MVDIRYARQQYSVSVKDNSKYFKFVGSAQTFENYVDKLTHCKDTLTVKKKKAQTQGKYKLSTRNAHKHTLVFD